MIQISELRALFTKETGYSYPDENTSDEYYINWLEEEVQVKCIQLDTIKNEVFIPATFVIDTNKKENDD